MGKSKLEDQDYKFDLSAILDSKGVMNIKAEKSPNLDGEKLYSVVVQLVSTLYNLLYGELLLSTLEEDEEEHPSSRSTFLNSLNFDVVTAFNEFVDNTLYEDDDNSVIKQNTTNSVFGSFADFPDKNYKDN